MEKDIKYSMLEGIIKNALEIEKELNSLQERFKIEGEDLESKAKQIELNGVFTGLERKLDIIKQFSQSVIEIVQFEEDLYKGTKK